MDFTTLFMTNEQHDLNVKAVKTMITESKKANVLFRKCMGKAPSNTDLKKMSNFDKSYKIKFDKIFAGEQLGLMFELGKTTYDDNIERGSASYPLFNGNWSCGNLGSMWTDIEYKGKQVRICFYNEARKVIYFQSLAD